ncbi:MAG TPA: dehydrogenase [Agromyces sp.]|nr:dehydrogenase [Agromyces sp.]
MADAKRSPKGSKGSKGPKRGEPLEFRSKALADALERQDIAAVALALRHGNTVVPLITPGPRDKPLDGGEVWTYRDANTGEVALLLFSDAANKPANLPPAVGLQSPAWLKSFLRRYESTITTVFLDIAGPHPMQASPGELLKALEA